MKEFELPKKNNWQLLSKRISKTIQSITPAADVYITTAPGDNYIQLGRVDSAVITDIAFHLTNPGEQELGDKLYIISQPDTSTANINYCYDDTDFYIARCGDPESPVCSQFSYGIQERDVTVFIYDGEKFSSTFDNC